MIVFFDIIKGFIGEVMEVGICIKGQTKIIFFVFLSFVNLFDLCW